MARKPIDPIDTAERLALAVEAMNELTSAFDEAEREIDSVLEKGAAEGFAESPEEELGEESVSSRLDAIFAELESPIGESGRGDPAEEQTKERPRRPAERRSDLVVSQLVRTLLSTRTVTLSDLEKVFEVTIAKIVEAVHGQAVTIYSSESDGIYFRHIAYDLSLIQSDPALAESLHSNIEQLKDTALAHGTGIVGKVIAENKPHVTLDAAEDEQHYFGVERRTGFPVHSMITVPIAYGSRVFGAIQVLNKNPRSGEHFFSHRDLKMAEEVADYAGRATYMAQNPGFVWPPVDLARYVAKLTRLECVDLNDIAPETQLLRVIGEATLRRFLILPLKKLSPDSIQAAMANPLDLQVRDGFQLATNLRLEVVVVAPEPQILEAIDRAFPRKPSRPAKDAFLKELEEKSRQSAQARAVALGSTNEASVPIISFVNQVLEDAYARGASDIHFEPFEDKFTVRYRIDGVLRPVLELPSEGRRAVTARLKIMAGLDIAEQRLPQDGRIHFKDFARSGLDIDLRVATGPMVWGEKTCLRLLDTKAAIVGIDKMGYSAQNFELYGRALEAPYGMILHCGPTGSGKTTSLYAALDHKNKPGVNIQTAEDPVEYMLAGVNQLQVKPSIGLTFSRALKCFLRQDPDIILVGEIRDLETASIAIEAALTGHQVFSTLHTNNAASTITRLTEMGIEPFMITGAVLAIVAQRLLRRLCTECRVPLTPTAEERRVLDLGDDEAPGALYKAGCRASCTRCDGAGYKGRLGVHEVLLLNGAVRDAASRPGATAAEIHTVAVEHAGLIPLLADAVDKVRAGLTDLDEVRRTLRQTT